MTVQIFKLLIVTYGLLGSALALGIATQEETKDVERSIKLIGAEPQEWNVGSWMNSRPVQLKDLRGKVVLVRWWTEGCPFCSATASALNGFYDEFHSRGLEVIGFYHHKSDQLLDVEKVHQYARKLGFRFPIAIDYDWRTLRRWWLDDSGASWTSVSFLIDRKGTIRHIHPGGQYVVGDSDYEVLRSKIQRLLAEK